MLKQFFQGSSWLALRSPEDGGGATTSDPATAPAAIDGNPPVPIEADPAIVAGDAEPKPPAKPEPKMVPEDRLNRTTAEKWTERRRAEAAESALALANETIASMKRAPVPVPGAETDINGEPVPAKAPLAPERPVTTPEKLREMAAEISRNEAFNTKVTESIQAGRKAYTDFDAVAANLQQFGDFPRHFTEALLETGKGQDVLYALGNDLTEADRIFSISNPIQQAIAIDRYAAKVQPKAPPKLVSSAPAPIEPKVGGQVRAVADISDPTLPMKDFIAMREKQVAANPRRR